jgi:hypothetical protein
MAVAHAHAPPLAEAGFEAAFDTVLDRLIDEELDALRVQDAIGRRPTFDELFAFYLAAGFVYPAKFAEIGDWLPAIEATWTRLLASGDEVFKIFTRRRFVDGRPAIKNTVSAVEHAPGTWQCQHLVSADRHEYLGTLSAFLAMAEWLERNPAAAYTRFAFRPGNRGVAALFADWQRAMPPGDASLRTFDYVAAPLEAVDARERFERSSVRVVRAGRDDADALRRFYGSYLSRVEVDSLRLDDPSASLLQETYGRLGLERRRSVFIAVAGETVVGALICNVGPLGANFSFLENAIEGVEIAPDMPPLLRVTAFRALLGAATRFYRGHERPLVIATIGPQYSDLVKTAGLAPQKQYTLFTGRNSAEGFVASRECFRRYYRALVLLDAAAGRTS